MPNLQVDSPVGLYNCPQQRTSQAFSSMDDLDAMTTGQTGGLQASAGSATHFSYQQAAAVLSPNHHHRSSPHRLVYLSTIFFKLQLNFANLVGGFFFEFLMNL